MKNNAQINKLDNAGSALHSTILPPSAANGQQPVKVDYSSMKKAIQKIGQAPDFKAIKTFYQLE